MLVFADKTTNIYTLTPEEHSKLLKDNVTKTYKKAPKNLERATNLEAQHIASSYNIDKRAESLASSPAFITLKDHKENFQTKLPCRLINPCKSNLGKVSKSILDRINSDIRNSIQVNQWKNTDEAISWFDSIENKDACSFIQLDIKEFYPTITKEILNEALEFAKIYTTISDKELRTINHCRKSLLFFNKEAWTKKLTNDCFDVTMGSYDGAEICELVGLFILNKLSSLINKSDAGLYRDDGLMVLRNMKGRSVDKMRKDIIKLFKSIGFQIEIVTGLYSVDFLDVTFNLKHGTYQPYKKPNDTMQYIHTSSNHPQQILKQLPIAIADRLSKNSSNEAIFEKAKVDYEDSLKKSGYKNINLTFTKEKTRRRKKKRTRNVIWFNPPYNKNVSTNVARKFLSLINKHFHSGYLKMLFNKNNIKVSYSCMENMATIIKSHNSKVSKSDTPVTASCNCRRKPECPLEGNCQVTSVIYKCEVTAPAHQKKVYIGLTEKSFKTRFNGHKQSLSNKKYKNSTSLSSYVWDLKEKSNVTPTLKWSTIKQVQSYTNNSRNCPLCLQEKFEILFYKDKSELLNKRSELIAKCRHTNKFLLANYKSKD